MTKSDLGIVSMDPNMILGNFHGTFIMCDHHKLHFPQWGEIEKNDQNKSV